MGQIFVFCPFRCPFLNFSVLLFSMPFTLPFYASTILRQPVHGRVKKKLAYRAMPFTSLKKLKSVRFTGMDPPFFCPFRHAHRHGARKATNALRAATGYQSFTSRDIRSPATRKSVDRAARRLCVLVWHHLHGRRTPNNPRPVACRSANAAGARPANLAAIHVGRAQKIWAPSSAAGAVDRHGLGQ